MTKVPGDARSSLTTLPPVALHGQLRKKEGMAGVDTRPSPQSPSVGRSHGAPTRHEINSVMDIPVSGWPAMARAIWAQVGASITAVRTRSSMGCIRRSYRSR